MNDYWDSLPRKGWINGALCAGQEADRWSATRLAEAPARRICARCPVTDDCLAFALRHEHVGVESRSGIYGGMNPAERERFAQALAAANVYPGSMPA